MKKYYYINEGRSRYMDLMDERDLNNPMNPCNVYLSREEAEAELARYPEYDEDGPCRACFDVHESLTMENLD